MSFLSDESGIYASQHIEDLIRRRIITAPSPVTPLQIQPASLDLRLGSVAYRVPASFLPGEHTTVEQRLDDLQMHLALDLSRPCMLEKGCVYIIPLQERLALPETIAAKANPKSTTGRLDVFTRLMTDHATEFDQVRAGYHGPLYVEVVPRTFSVVVEAGTTLNQLRLLTGRPGVTDSDLMAIHEAEPLVYLGNDPASPILGNGLWVTVDLQGIDGSDIVGYRARPHGMIDLSRVSHYDPADFWEPVYRPRKGGVILNPDDFYILVSREKIRIPPDYAAEMVAYEPSIGEFRVHYAGFFDPGFGHASTIRGSRGVLEVRSHEVPFLLEDGQTVARLVYERMRETPQQLYGQGIGSNYQGQGLKLSKHFKSL